MKYQFSEVNVAAVLASFDADTYHHYFSKVTDGLWVYMANADPNKWYVSATPNRIHVYGDGIDVVMISPISDSVRWLRQVFLQSDDPYRELVDAIPHHSRASWMQLDQSKLQTWLEDLRRRGLCRGCDGTGGDRGLDLPCNTCEGQGRNDESMAEVKVVDSLEETLLPVCYGKASPVLAQRLIINAFFKNEVPMPMLPTMEKVDAAIAVPFEVLRRFVKAL